MRINKGIILEIEGCEIGMIKKNTREEEVRILAEIILKNMTEKELPRKVLEEALNIVDEKFLNDATI